MLDLNPENGLPRSSAWKELLQGGSSDSVWHEVERALIQPAEELMKRPSKRFRAGLLDLGFILANDSEASPKERAFALCSQAIELLHAGSMIVDDVQDGSNVRRGGPAIHRMVGVPGAICAGNWLYFWPLRLIREAQLAPEQEHAMITRYCDAVETAHYGQAVDLAVKVDGLPQGEVAELSRGVSALKTGAITKLAVSLGAILAGADQIRVDRVAAFGLAFGVVLQDLDDLGNLVGTAQPEKRFEDLLQGKPSGVWSHVARHASTPEYAHFAEVVKMLRAGDSAPLEHWVKKHGLVEAMREEARAQLERVVADAAAIPDRRRPCVDQALTKLREELLHAYC